MGDLRSFHIFASYGKPTLFAHSPNPCRSGVSREAISFVMSRGSFASHGVPTLSVYSQNPCRSGMSREYFGRWGEVGRWDLNHEEHEGHEGKMTRTSISGGPCSVMAARMSRYGGRGRSASLHMWIVTLVLLTTCWDYQSRKRNTV